MKSSPLKKMPDASKTRWRPYWVDMVASKLRLCGLLIGKLGLERGLETNHQRVTQ